MVAQVEAGKARTKATIATTIVARLKFWSFRFQQTSRAAADERVDEKVSVMKVSSSGRDNVEVKVE